jgi:hypothetical protein
MDLKRFVVPTPLHPLRVATCVVPLELKSAVRMWEDIAAILTRPAAWASAVAIRDFHVAVMEKVVSSAAKIWNP